MTAGSNPAGPTEKRDHMTDDEINDLLVANNYHVYEAEFNADQVMWFVRVEDRNGDIYVDGCGSNRSFSIALLQAIELADRRRQ